MTPPVKRSRGRPATRLIIELYATFRLNGSPYTLVRENEQWILRAQNTSNQARTDIRVTEVKKP